MVVYLCSMLFNSWNTSPLSPWPGTLLRLSLKRSCRCSCITENILHHKFAKYHFCFADYYIIFGSVLYQRGKWFPISNFSILAAGRGVSNRLQFFIGTSANMAKNMVIYPYKNKYFFQLLVLIYIMQALWPPTYALIIYA